MSQYTNGNSIAGDVTVALHSTLAEQPSVAPRGRNAMPSDPISDQVIPCCRMRPQIFNDKSRPTKDERPSRYYLFCKAFLF